MNMRLSTLTLLLLLLPFSEVLLAQETEQAEISRERTFITSIILYASEKKGGILLDSQKGWRRLSVLNPTETKDLPPPRPGTVRKWRLHAILYDQTMSGLSTVQVKLRLPDREPPLFTLPWRRNPEGVSEKYSNWFQEEPALNGSLYDTKGTSEVRLLAQQTDRGEATVYSLSLEAWDISIIPNANELFQYSAKRESTVDENEIQAAKTPIFPTVKNPYEERERTLPPSREQATQAALDFINIILENDLPKYYSSFFDLVQLMNKGTKVEKYSIPLPLENYTQVDLKEYKENYQYKVYTISEVQEIFPDSQLLRTEGLKDTDFIFDGSTLFPGKKELILDPRTLIFAIRKVPNGWKVVGVLAN